MRIVIIEDERLTAEDLAETIIRVAPDAQIIATLYSLKEAVLYFGENDRADLIFSDIQLGDGLSFEVFKTCSISTPVIFCTAYDEYALNAFKANGIDYILKPFTEIAVADALARFYQLKADFTRSAKTCENIVASFENRKNLNNASVLAYIRDKIIPVKLIDIAFFYIENETTHILTFDSKSYTINKTLEELEEQTGESFFRANRKYLINRKAVKDATQYFYRKPLINLSIPHRSSEPITVSKVKAAGFLNWLSGN